MDLYRSASGIGFLRALRIRILYLTVLKVDRISISSAVNTTIMIKIMIAFLVGLKIILLIYLKQIKVNHKKLLYFH